MNRAEKFHKLARAIREYRGRHYVKPDGGIHWTQPPKPSARRRLERWLKDLDLDVETSMKAIDGFKSWSEYRSWMTMVQSEGR